MSNLGQKRRRIFAMLFAVTIAALGGCGASPAGPLTSSTAPTGSATASQAVGPQYDTVHVYVQPGQFDNFVRSWISTFGGTTSTKVITNVTPTPSTTASQLVFSPVGTLSVFEFSSPIPFPFGTERTGWLVRDFDAGVVQAREAGAVLQVSPFDDPVGRDAVVQFPGGVNAQLYWHTAAPSYAPLTSVPDNRVYISGDAADAFLKSYSTFTHARVVSDNASADGASIGRPGRPFRQIRLKSDFGNTVVIATDGKLPYPYGHEVAGYAVGDVPATVAKAHSSGAAVLVPVGPGVPSSALLQFPGGYIAEIHSA